MASTLGGVGKAQANKESINLTQWPPDDHSPAAKLTRPCCYLNPASKELVPVLSRGHMTHSTARRVAWSLHAASLKYKPDTKLLGIDGKAEARLVSISAD